jgi:hypothetical protein
MKNNKKILSVLILVIILGFVAYLFYSKNKDVSPTDNSTILPDSALTYKNIDYGFTFSLPDDWKGYSIVQNTWQGNPLTTATANETGPKLLIRNPKWTPAVHYEDIPIMIFSLAQWNSYTAGNFAVSAAPINASELARNNSYVFALPPRWDFDYSEGFAEAENILKSNPLKVFDIGKVSILKDGRQCYTFNHEATTTEPYTVNEFLDISISGAKVTGIKSGTQKGPDMTNGYNGTIVGTLNNDMINDVFSYTIEGSSNKEAEIYRSRADQIGIEKMRYPLIEKGGILVPDTTKEFTALLYARVGCVASN